MPKRIGESLDRAISDQQHGYGLDQLCDQPRGLPQQIINQGFWRSTQRKPRWQVVLSTGWAMRAAGR